jgi:hypothetical protein
VVAGPNETVFEFPSTKTLYLLPAAIVCGVFFLAEITTPSRSHLVLAILAIFAGTVQLIRFSGLRYRVALSDDGIRYMPYGQVPISLLWSEIANLRLRETSLRAQLVVSDAVLLRSIILDYRLDKFEDLLCIVVDRATNCDPHLALPKTFHTSYLDQVIVVIVFFVSIGLAIHFANLNQIYAAALGLFALLCVGILAAVPHNLTVSFDSIAQGYLGRRREIAPASITGLRFGVQRGSRGSLWTVVLVETSESKPLKLAGFTEGSLAVYYALRDAWQPDRARP